MGTINKLHVSTRTFAGTADTTEGAETIDGAASKVINAAYGVVELYSNGTHWYVV